MNDSDALLVVERGPVPTTQIPLNIEQMTIGRSAGNDLVLADPEVSRRHIRVVKRADGFAVEDIGSTNGTFVNGQRISHLTLLQDGDTIDLGDTVRLRFVVLTPAIAGESFGHSVDTAEKPTQMFAPANQAAEMQPIVQPSVSPPPPQQRAQSQQPPAVRPPLDTFYPPPPAYPSEEPRRGRGLLVGCGLLIALLLVCAGTFLILDAYDQGRILYCGPLSSFFELILGPFGFAPVCP